MATYNIISEKQKPWGYEIKIEVISNSLERLGTIIISMPKELSSTYKNNKSQSLANKFELKLSAELVSDEQYYKEEITNILREKGYLEEDEEFAPDMPIKTITPEVIK